MTTTLIVAGFWLTGFLSMFAGAALRGWIGRGVCDEGLYDSRYVNGMLVGFVAWPVAVAFGLYVMLGDMRKHF